MRSYVYFIGAGQHIKIGMTHDPKKRLSQISTGNPFETILIMCIRCRDTEYARRVELDLHEKFSLKRASGEWFLLNKADIDDVIEIYSKFIEMENEAAIPMINIPTHSPFSVTDSLINKYNIPPRFGKALSALIKRRGIDYTISRLDYLIEFKKTRARMNDGKTYASQWEIDQILKGEDIVPSHPDIVDFFKLAKSRFSDDLMALVSVCVKGEDPEVVREFCNHLMPIIKNRRDHGVLRSKVKEAWDVYFDNPLRFW